MNSHPPRSRFGASHRFAHRGFTLIELMIAVCIVSLLAAVAYPSYSGSVRKSRRADAAEGATAVMQAQERWRANNPSYTSELGSLNVSATTVNGLYTMALSDHTATAYTLSFSPVSGKGQTNDTGCTAMTVTVTAGSPIYAPSGCWSR